MIKYLWILFFSTPTKIWAAACCGGGLSLPTLISGDQKAMLSYNVSFSEVDSRVGNDGFWYEEKDLQTQSMQFNAAHIFYDRWQFGFSLPFVKKIKYGESEEGLSDIFMSLAYEAVPNWDYHPIRPKVYLFSKLRLPTGKSIYEAENRLALDAVGKGTWALGFGGLATKDIAKFDAFLQLYLERNFAETMSTRNLNFVVEDYYSYLAAVGIGYNHKEFRTGPSLNFVFEEAIDIYGDITSEGSFSRYVDLSWHVSYFFLENWLLVFNYTDQTLIGSPSNSSLSKSVGLQLQKNFSR